MEQAISHGNGDYKPKAAVWGPAHFILLSVHIYLAFLGLAGDLRAWGVCRGLEAAMDKEDWSSVMLSDEALQPSAPHYSRVLPSLFQLSASPLPSCTSCL